MKGPMANNIEKMFDAIAGDYDRLNHIMSLGTDRGWRHRAIRRVVDRSVEQTILDAACGTGDFSIAMARVANPSTKITGADLSENMLEVMRQKVVKAGLQGRISAIKANCEALPFDDDTFDAVTIAFGIRNFENREVALQEFRRVIRPGGKLLVLELSVPRNRFLRWVYNIYFTRAMGRRRSLRPEGGLSLPAGLGHQFPRPGRMDRHHVRLRLLQRDPHPIYLRPLPDVYRHQIE